MKLEIVSHCWRYGRLLTYQLSSLALYPPCDVNVTMTVFFTGEDADTQRVIEFFAAQPLPAGVRIRGWELPRPQLLLRLIGRNLAALATTADWVWFTDCDHLFRAGALDALPAQVAVIDAPLVYPRSIQVHRAHALGDAAVAAVSGGPRLIDVDPADFGPRHTRRAIGGLQIARGDVMRRLGYCKESRRQRRPAVRWVRTVEDTAFRRTLGARGVAVNLPNVYRLRHSQCGRRHADTVL